MDRVGDQGHARRGTHPTRRMIKAVFDSSVLVAALLTPKGLSRALVDRAKANEFALCLSPEIITETHKRLVTRKHLRERYGYTDEEVAYFIRDIRKHGFPYHRSSNREGCS